MRILLISLFVFSAYPLSAQDWFLNGWGAEVLPHLGSRRLVAANQINRDEVRAIERQETATSGYGIGIFYRNRAEKIGTRWGLRFQNTGFDGNRREFPDENPPRETEIEYRTQILEMPMWLDFYQNFGERSSFVFSFGLSPALHFGQEFGTTFFTEGQPPVRIVDDENYRGFNIAFMTGMGFERRLGQRMVLGVQPQFQYWLLGNVIDDGGDFNRNLFNIGLRLSLMRIN